jgi:hypothetical protein
LNADFKVAASPKDESTAGAEDDEVAITTTSTSGTGGKPRNGKASKKGKNLKGATDVHIRYLRS